MSLVTIALMIYILTTLEAPTWCYVLLIIDYIVTAVRTIRRYRQQQALYDLVEILGYVELQMQDEYDEYDA